MVSVTVRLLYAEYWLVRREAKGSVLGKLNDLPRQSGHD